MKASVGLLAMWTGELSANVSHMESMAIHQMDDKELDQFEKVVRAASHSINSLIKYIKEAQETA